MLFLRFNAIHIKDKNVQLYVQTYNACLSCALLRLRAFLSKFPFYYEVLFAFLHLSSPNLMKNDHNFMFFDYKVYTLSHVCFEKMPRN